MLLIFETLNIHVYNVGVTGQLLYWIMWEAVRRLEEMNLKVNFSNNYSEYAIHDVL